MSEGNKHSFKLIGAGIGFMSIFASVAFLVPEGHVKNIFKIIMGLVLIFVLLWGTGVIKLSKIKKKK